MPRYKYHLRIALIVFGSFLSTTGRAFVEVGSDIHFVTLSQYDVMLRTHNYLLIKLGRFAIGPMVQYEKPHTYVEDIIYGSAARLRIGGDLSVELGGGAFQRKYTVIGPGDDRTVLTGTGFGATIVPALQLNKYFRLSLPIVGKKTLYPQNEADRAKALPTRWEIEAYPAIGFALGM